ncbi:AER397Cp [Eremothecium gossypii ATCC 10895]|uniref:AER397Cp n=1 Tax=Eremothecium gossypii (strain ATCC 10895 / CBS 109.51 / FGSC 9923 / NRRL Y-1056) TaxID=284811 RepID=Q755X1_EREGS|nr:AER397Cp [Eremothecium gossypii ATCC 10895]AAS53076.1 AER397Cp [Eremothecium gossypii ATCC 10895]
MSIFSTPLKSNVGYAGALVANGGPAESTELAEGGGAKTRVVPASATSQFQLSTYNPMSMGTANEHVRVSGLGSMGPLELASQYINHLQRRDTSTLVLDERSYYNNGVNYNFSKELGGLGALTPFERINVVNIPDEILQEVSKAEIRNDVGIFPELDRCWIIIDNKLILWSIKDPSDFQSIDDIKHTILKVSLVRPKPGVFVGSVNYVLLIATPFDVYLLAVSYQRELGELNVFNTGMSVSVNGLDVSNIISYEKTGQIFFTGKINGTNIWELQYSSSEDWFNSKCNKVCLTQMAISSLLPSNIISRIPGSGLLRSFFEEESKFSQECIVQLAIDQSRGVLYSLSSKSVIRAYKINNKSLDGPVSIEPAYIRRIIGTTTAKGAAILGASYLRISKIAVVSQSESNNLFLVAITVGGVRLYFNGSLSTSNIEALTLESIKFPPSSVTPEAIEQELQQQQQQQIKTIPFYSSLNSTESIQLKYQKKSSVLLETSSASTIISPGIFFSAVVKRTPSGQSPHDSNTNTPASHPVQHKLFVSVPDYGILKNHGKYIENASFLETTGPVKEIVPISALFNATDKPEGYANIFATQYSVEPLKVAVLTNTSVEIYRYRTPDQVFESLIDNPLPFVLNYGLAEACSSALFVTCKFNRAESLRSSALTFFTVGIPNVVEIKPRYNNYAASAVSSLLNKHALTATPQKTNSIAPANSNNGNYNLDDVVLSPRFYGIALLITRLFRDIWNKNIFLVKETARYDYSGSILRDSVSNGDLISMVSISKTDLEYYLSSIMILNEFFMTYGTSITTITATGITTGKAVDRSEEVAYQAESIAINAMIRLVQSIKEALSFLNVLFEESEIEGYEGQYLAFKDIMKFLSLDVQSDLTKLKFKDIFAPNDQSKRLVREILSSIINRNISRGGFIEYIATALQERCGSFCSSSDVLGFRAVEHLRKAKEVGLRDFDTLNYHLTNATRLFEKIVDDISIDKLKEAVAIMLELNYFPKTIEFLLNIANLTDKGKLAYQYVSDGYLEHDEKKKYFDKRVCIYDLVFQTLIKIDDLASGTTSNPAKGKDYTETEFAKLREESYHTALSYDDKLFHYQLYDWLVSQNSQQKLLQLDTDFILPYLQEKSVSSLDLSNLLWVYHSKRSNFLVAAQILYSLSYSDFDMNLHTRIEYLSRANGYCNGVCPPNQRHQMIQLSSMIQELFDVAVIQDELLALVTNDSRLSDDTRKGLVKQLDGKILPVSDLFNDFADPLGYYEICLTIFKISDFRNHEEIMSKWNELFDSMKSELKSSGGIEDSTNFINLLSSVVVKTGKSVRTSEFVFPIADLLPVISNLFYECLPNEHIEAGSIASIFTSAGVSYDKLYYVLKDLIETSESVNTVYKREIAWLIKYWYQSDRKLRDIITYDDLRNLDEYSIETDPIDKYMKRTGNSI